MRYIKRYNNFYKENLIIGSKIDLFSDIDITLNEYDLFKSTFDKVLNNYKIEESIKDEIRNYIIDNQNEVNENFFNKLKERFPKATEVSKKLSDKAEGVLNNILQKTKDAVSFVKKISEGIKELFLNAIEKSKEYFKEQILNGKLADKIKEITKVKKDGLVKDLKEIKKVVDFYRKEFLSKLISSNEKNFTDFLSKEQQPISESILLESGNVIATLVHGIEEIPPFSWLHKLAKAGEAGATQFIKMLSDITGKMGGPTFTLPVIALILGEVMEYLIKGQVGGWLITLVGTTTPFGLAITGMKMTATFISLLTVIDAIVGQKILGKEESNKEESNKEESEKNI